MFQISEFLARFKNLTNTEKQRKEIIIGVFEKNKITVTLEQVSILKNTVFVKVHPIIKTEIFLKKEIILDQLKEIPNVRNISDIK